MKSTMGSLNPNPTNADEIDHEKQVAEYIRRLHKRKFQFIKHFWKLILEVERGARTEDYTADYGPNYSNLLIYRIKPF